MNNESNDMKTWKQFLTEQAEHEFSSTQVNLPLMLSSKITRWAKSLIDKDDLFGDGFEDEPHVTVLFGLHSNEPDQVKELLKDEPPVELVLQSTSIFETDEFDVVKLGVESEDLARLHNKIADHCEFTATHQKYSPHCTLAYVKKGCGKKYAGDKEFEGTKVTIDKVLFSNKNRIKTSIVLGT